MQHPAMHSANRSTPWLAACLVWLSACDSCGAPAQPPAPTTPDDSNLIADVFLPEQPSEFFPMQAGDRWAYRTSNGELRMRGITAIDDLGDAYLFGDGLTRAARFRAGDSGILRVVDGAELPWLNAPAEPGREWSYDSGDAHCRARYADGVDRIEVGGLPLSNCVRVERSCQLPAGKPFPAATREEHHETYCPGVGLVREELSFDPPPAIEGVAPAQTEELVSFRVAGGPLPPMRRPFDCQSLLLLETDVQTACGPTLRRDPHPPSSRRAECVRVFQSPEGSLRVRVQELEVDATADDLERAVEAQEGRFGEFEGRFLLLLDPSAACPRERAERLLPLLHSLVARETR